MLAINGGKPEVRGRIEPFDTIGKLEGRAALSVIGSALSGYLAGKERGGKWVRLLEKNWEETFQVEHAIACNSATSGLLAAAFAAGLGPGDRFGCSPMTMSATAAAPMFTGATPEFRDVDVQDFGLNPYETNAKAVFVTSLFGHPAQLQGWRDMADAMGNVMIEDNAQSPFAMERGKFAGTVGHIGVWSLNVHKPIQCGEGGMITTNDPDLAGYMRDFINHGENVGRRPGLNLRMPEISAAIANAQLRRGQEIIQERCEQASELLSAIGNIPGLKGQYVRENCTHVYYTIPFLIDRKRAEFCAALRAEGVPIVEGYVEPLYRMSAFKAFAAPCPVAESLQDGKLFYFENCAWTLSDEQITQVGTAFRKVAEGIL